MKEGDETRKDLRSIKNALWMIVAILLMQLGFPLTGFRSTPIAEVVMMLGFLSGFVLMIWMLVRAFVRLLVQPNDP
jgi:hypothetical protein